MIFYEISGYVSFCEGETVSFCFMFPESKYLVHQTRIVQISISFFAFLFEVRFNLSFNRDKCVGLINTILPNLAWFGLNSIVAYDYNLANFSVRDDYSNRNRMIVLTTFNPYRVLLTVRLT